MIDAERLVGTVFSGLSSLIVEGVEDAGDTIVVRAGTRDEPVACPCCGEGNLARARLSRADGGRRSA